ncbi:MAG: hypothetical protein HYV08_04930 [Deltaproteobacteria bacterium]|nr:hypothetical protein [Deltaproteobacteria bacterium]MBI3077032.1 hypothetical protein [Deltaproteobacteria bacterium]
MTRQEILRTLRGIRGQARRIKDGTDSPAIERSMHMVDMYCHMAQWQLGELEGVMPEVETGAGWEATAAPTPRKATKTASGRHRARPASRTGTARGKTGPARRPAGPGRRGR